MSTEVNNDSYEGLNGQELAKAHLEADNNSESGYVSESQEAPSPFIVNAKDWDEESKKRLGVNEEGKILGKYNDVRDLAEAYKKLSDEKAMQGRERKNQEVTAQKAEEDSRIQSKLMNDIANNDFNITEDMFQEAEANGVSRNDMKLRAYEMKEAANVAYNAVGGKEEYVKMSQWMGENWSESQIQGFAEAMQFGGETGFKNKFATELMLQTVYSQYKSAIGQSKAQDNTPHRISGHQPTNAPAEGFQSRQEYNRMMDYLRTPEGMRDKGAQRKYDAMLASTDMRLLR